MIFAFILALLIVAASDLYDVTMTEKGIKKGVSVEAFTWLVGDKPSAVALYLRDWLIIAFASIPAAVGLVLHSPIFWGSLTAYAVLAARHINGGLQWRTLLNGGTLKPAASTWYGKLFTL